MGVGFGGSDKKVLELDGRESRTTLNGSNVTESFTLKWSLVL